jgi:ribosomal protein S18 acetylase RimI-like enzyme
MKVAFVDDPALAGPLRDIVNAAYEAGEAGLWLPGHERVSAAAVAGCIARGELAAACEDGRVVGCVRALFGELGLLAVAPGATGGGVGRALVGFAEEASRARGAGVMRLELLVPREGTHPAKVRLEAWYTRLGYRVVGRSAFAAAYPEMAPRLAVACDLVVYEKPLGGPGELLAG